jgi:two-component system, OmpR family, alkaline phosphatase synthesis response regulator PhoP
MTKILVIDDEKDIAELISYNLKKEGFSAIQAYDGESALGLVKTQSPDLIILDLMLPKISGLDVCRSIRRNPVTAGTPIIMLTAKADEIDKVVGLEMGADDYITKPFGVKELIARVRAMLRRMRDSNNAQLKEEFRSGNLLINYASYEVRLDNKKILLSPTELKLLFFFSQHPGRVYSRDQILNNVWNDDTFVTPRTVDVHVQRLRSQIEKDTENPQYILTIRGVGYKFAESLSTS